MLILLPCFHSALLGVFIIFLIGVLWIYRQNVRRKNQQAQDVEDQHQLARGRRGTSSTNDSTQLPTLKPTPSQRRKDLEAKRLQNLAWGVVDDDEEKGYLEQTGIGSLSPEKIKGMGLARDNDGIVGVGLVTTPVTLPVLSHDQPSVNGLARPTRPRQMQQSSSSYRPPAAPQTSLSPPLPISMPPPAAQPQMSPLTPPTRSGRTSNDPFRTPPPPASSRPRPAVDPSEKFNSKAHVLTSVRQMKSQPKVAQTSKRQSGVAQQPAQPQRPALARTSSSDNECYF